MRQRPDAAPACCSQVTSGPITSCFTRIPRRRRTSTTSAANRAYGGRERIDATPAHRRRILAQEVSAALKRGGNPLIPAFAVERTQELLLDLTILFDTGVLPKVPVFLDSPLAIKATKVFVKNASLLENVANMLGRSSGRTSASRSRRKRAR